VPRRYNLRKRAEQQAATRARIVAATLDIYRARGFAAATTRAVAKAADVAPATVRNHFPTAVGLAAAAADAILTQTGLPGAEIFEGLPTATERVERLARELAAFFERSSIWWHVRERDPDLAAAWRGLDARYYDHIGRMVAAAVEPAGGDAATVATVTTIVGGSLYFALQGSGSSSDEAVAIELDLILPWLRNAGLPGGAGANRPIVQPSGDAGRPKRGAGSGRRGS
jgi:AcrR family transcriptional regulator